MLLCARKGGNKYKKKIFAIPSYERWTLKHAIGESQTFCQEMDVVQKTPKTVFFEQQKICITSLWEELEAKLLTTGKLLGYP